MDLLDNYLYFMQMTLIVGLWLFFWMGPFCGVLWLGYYLVSLRLRRQERARFFLDLMDIGMKQGRAIEETVISISDARDRSMGVHFHVLAYYLKDGLPLREALLKVPRLLPPQVNAMLRTGLQIGDLSKVLPACRQLSRDAVSQTRGGVNYLVAVAFVGFPANMILVTLLQTYVIPQFAAVTDGMGIPTPAGLAFIMTYKLPILVVQLLLFLAVWSMVLIYIDGPRLFVWSEKMFGSVAHRVIYALPWRHKRFQRDFSLMLGILIDSGMPEGEAVTHAAECTANGVFMERAKLAVAELQRGMKLPEAVALVDDTGDFHWRLTNALHEGGGFLKAVAGWNDALDAKAFQLEQTTTQVITAGLVVVNGIVIGAIVISLFSVLIAIINNGLLW